MKQFIRDYPTLIRGDRKTQVITGIVAICLLWLFFGDSGGRSRAPKTPKQVNVGSNDPSEQWRDLITRFDGQLKQLSARSESQQKDIEDLQKSMSDYEATTAEIFKKILERLAEVQSSVTNVSGTSQPRNLEDMAGLESAGSGPEELEQIGGVEQVAIQPPPKPEPRKLAFVGPGDSVRVKLLAGVNAPTDGTPYPVLFKLIGDVTGPDGTSLPLGEARLIAAAQGSLPDSRALFRMTRLSIRLPNGRRKEFGIDGWIVGEDGIRGMEGVLIDPIGKAIAGAGMVGALSGLGQGIAAANTENYNNGYQSGSYINNDKIPEYAGGIALSSAADQWQKIIQQRLAQLTPVVQVLSGREGTAVFSQSLAIPDLFEQLDEDEPQLAFNSLD